MKTNLAQKTKWFLFVSRSNLNILLLSFLFPGYTRESLNVRRIPHIGFEYVKADGQGNVCFDKEEWNENGNIFLKTIVDRPLFTQNLLNKCSGEGKDFLKFARRIHRTKWSKASNSHILSVLEDLKKRSYLWGIWLTFPQTVDKFLEGYIKSNIIRGYAKDSGWKMKF